MAREYPDQPVVGVGAVIVRGDRALVVKRGHEPRKGEWSLPGGLVELGESLTDAVRREIREETNLDITPGPIIETFDRVHRDDAGRIRYHFVIVDFVCWSDSGTATPGSDAEDIAWIAADEIDSYKINPHAAEVIRRGLHFPRP